MKKFFIVLMFFLISFLGLSVYAEENDISYINIGVDEPFDDINIGTSSTYSKSIDYIWTCIYDRLLELDGSGGLTYSLLDEVTFLPDPDAIYSPINFNNYDLTMLIDDLYELGWTGFYEILDFEDLTNLNDFLLSTGVFRVEITLRSDVSFHNGSSFDAYDLYDYISFAQNNPGSRAYIQWQPVVNMQVDQENEYKMVVQLSFNGLNYGFMDFVYSLSSPAASIGMANTLEDSCFGTGAYILDSISQNSLHQNSTVYLSKNNYWWGDNSNSVDRLIFNYNSEPNPSAINSTYDIEIISSENLIPAYEGAEYYYTEPDFVVANNPIILKSNHNELSSDIFLSDFVSSRRFFDNDFDIYFNSDFYINSLLRESYDQWAYINKFDGSTDDGDYYTYVNMACSGSASVSYISSIMEDLFEQNSNGFNELNRYVFSNDFYGSYTGSGFDCYITEVNVESIGSLKAHLDQTNNSDELYLYSLLEKCGTTESYIFMVANIQLKLLRSDSIAYMGWTYKNIYVNNQNLYSASSLCPCGFCPYGDAARIDFRNIILVSD